MSEKNELATTLAQLRGLANKRDELSFGDAGAEVHSVIAKIAHHLCDDLWAKLSRASLSYIKLNPDRLESPTVSVSYGRDGKADSLSLQLRVKLDSTIQEFIDQYGRRATVVCSACKGKTPNGCNYCNSGGL